MVQVHHDEGVANRIDPESCANTREGIGEALTGERIGQPLSRESTLILGADVVPVTEGNTDGRDNASAQTARRGLRHWHVRTLFARETGGLMVGPRHSSCEANEQSRATDCGVGGAKGGGRGECESAKHGPGTGPGNRVTGAGAHTASRKAKEEGEVHRALPSRQY